MRLVAGGGRSVCRCRRLGWGGVVPYGGLLVSLSRLLVTGSRRLGRCLTAVLLLGRWLGVVLGPRLRLVLSNGFLDWVAGLLLGWSLVVGGLLWGRPGAVVLLGRVGPGWMRFLLRLRLVGRLAWGRRLIDRLRWGRWGVGGLGWWRWVIGGLGGGLWWGVVGLLGRWRWAGLVGRLLLLVGLLGGRVVRGLMGRGRGVHHVNGRGTVGLVDQDGQLVVGQGNVFDRWRRVVTAITAAV